MGTDADNTVKIEGFVIYNPKGRHYFAGYSGDGVYYATPIPEEAYIFLVEGNARAMASRLRGKTLIVAPIKIVKSIDVDLAHGETVVADPI